MKLLSNREFGRTPATLSAVPVSTAQARTVPVERQIQHRLTPSEVDELTEAYQAGALIKVGGGAVHNPTLSWLPPDRNAS